MRFFEERIRASQIEECNSELLAEHRANFEELETKLARSGLRIGRILRMASQFTVALPSWGFAQGGTRFGRFPAAREPRSVEEKVFGAAVVNDLTRITPRVSLHIPWDTPQNPASLKKLAKRLGLGFDAMNSNTFQDQPGQRYSYRFGSLSHTDSKVRRQAIEHNLNCIQIGQAIGSDSLVIWLADGIHFPGQQNFRRAFDRTLDSLENIYSAMPDDFRMLIEYKPFEPAFYSTVMNDWGSALLACQELGERADCLVDLGHHLPNTNIEQIVSRLLGARRLGGFHFNDSKYADDDLSAGSIRPYQLFLIFNELLDAAADPLLRQSGKGTRKPAYMIDQSHNIKDPVEDLMGSAVEIHRAFVKALLVNRKTLAFHQNRNDVVMAERVLKSAFETDVSAILAEVRLRKGGALDPIRAFRRIGGVAPAR